MTNIQQVTVLTVDDEENITDMLQEYLKKDGFSVITAHSGQTALEILQKEPCDIVILDVAMPGMDGIEVCRRIRLFSDIYVLMLTAKTEEIDRVVGLSVGADDYISKPFSPRELTARINAMLRRPRHANNSSAAVKETEQIFHFGSLIVYPERREVIVNKETVQLTAREFDMLLELIQYAGKVYTRGQLLERVWGNEYYDDHIVDVHMANLRKKIEEDPAHPYYIETVRGVGYRFRGKNDGK